MVIKGGSIPKEKSKKNAGGKRNERDIVCHHKGEKEVVVKRRKLRAKG